jgi:hypothetical protein
LIINKFATQRTFYPLFMDKTGSSVGDFSGVF